MTANSSDKTQSPIAWQDFFADTPPSTRVHVQTPIAASRSVGGKQYFTVNLPEVMLKCKKCGGVRWFAAVGGTKEFAGLGLTNAFETYACKNCSTDTHTFALRIGPRITDNVIGISKFGQIPAFGIEMPAHLRNLLSKDDRALFEKGLDAEARGLGIGAFSYYRRVLDNQRTRIFDRVIEAAVKLGGDPALLEELARAKEERQFTKAVEPLKQALPKFLNIEGHNPLTLLYDAVSNGMHAESDAECMTSAQTIRTLLEHLLLKADEAMQSDDVVKGAVNALLQAKQKREEKAKAKAKADLPPA